MKLLRRTPKEIKLVVPYSNTVYAVVRERADHGDAIALCFWESDAEAVLAKHPDAVVIPVEVQE